MPASIIFLTAQIVHKGDVENLSLQCAYTENVLDSEV